MEFCVYCLKNVDVTIEEKVEEITWKGEKFSCVQKYARCKECGKLVDIGELHDFNLFAVYDAYREKKDIISYADVIALTEKYKSVVSIRNLSKILGMGEHTLERYCDRCIPTKTFSDILKDLKQRGAAYLLEKLKSNHSFLSDKQYAKMLQQLSTMASSERPPLLMVYIESGDMGWSKNAISAYAA